MRSVLLVFTVLAFTAYGQLVIKARALAHAKALMAASAQLNYLVAMFTDVWVLSGLAAAVVAAVFWILAIQRLEIGYAYPFMALSFVLVPVGAAALFGEPLPATQLFGIALIIAGVTVSALAR